MQAWDERPTSLVGEAGEQIKGVRRQGVLECQPTREGGAGEAGEQDQEPTRPRSSYHRRPRRLSRLHGFARVCAGRGPWAQLHLLAFVRAPIFSRQG